MGGVQIGLFKTTRQHAVRSLVLLDSLASTRDGRYLIVCDIPLKILFMIKNCLLAIITISLVDDVVSCATN